MLYAAGDNSDLNDYLTMTDLDQTTKDSVLFVSLRTEYY